jgi:hypothetical protein
LVENSAGGTASSEVQWGIIVKFNPKITRMNRLEKLGIIFFILVG